MEHSGELMALAAAAIFSVTSVLFTGASRRLGVGVVNFLRIPAAACLLMLAHLAVLGTLWPVHAGLAANVLLGLSGVIGLTAGDSALFASFTRVGPRRGMMMMATAPVFTVVAAWFLLGEHLRPATLAGIAIVTGGILLAVSGREGGGGDFGSLPRATLRAGYLLGLAAAAGQGIGSALAKLGMEDLDPLGATVLRMGWAAVAGVIVLGPHVRRVGLRARLRDRRGAAALACAVVMGPFVSVWISLAALKRADAGVVQVFLSMVPIFTIAPSWIVYRDRPTGRSVAGVMVAVAGGVLLFLR